MDRRDHSDARKQFLLPGSFSPASDHWFLLPKETMHFLPSVLARLPPSPPLFPGHMLLLSQLYAPWRLQAETVSFTSEYTAPRGVRATPSSK